MNYDVTYCSQPCGNRKCGLRLPDDAFAQAGKAQRPVSVADYGNMRGVCQGFEPRVDKPPKP